MYGFVVQLHSVDHLDTWKYKKNHFTLHTCCTAFYNVKMIRITFPYTSLQTYENDRSIFSPYKFDAFDMQNYFPCQTYFLTLVVNSSTAKKYIKNIEFMFYRIYIELPMISSGHVEQSRSAGWLPRIFSVSMNVVGIFENGSKPFANSHVVIPIL